MALQQFLLRFRDPLGNPRDLQITDGSDGGYRLSVRNKGELLVRQGDAIAVPTGDTVNLVSRTTTDDTFVSGFYVSGETDAKFELTLNGVTLFKKRINYFRREAYVWFDDPIYLSTGQTILLTVTNNNADLKDFEGSVFEAI